MSKNYMKVILELEEPKNESQLDLLSGLAFVHNCLGIQDWEANVPNDAKILSIATELEDLSTYKNQYQGIEYWFATENDCQQFLSAIAKEDIKIKSQNTLQEDSQDWMAEWRKHFKAFNVCSIQNKHKTEEELRQKNKSNQEEIWIVPAWQEPKEEWQNWIKIHPGQAFGTGTHATTKLCLQQFLSIKDQLAEHLHCLDFGAGTGILGITLQKYFPQAKCSYVEIDPVACEQIHLNLEINQEQINLQKAEVLQELPTQKFQLIFANILAPVLLENRSTIEKMLDGYLILSGLLEEDKSFIQKFLENSELKLIHEEKRGEWTSFLLSSQRL